MKEVDWGFGEFAHKTFFDQSLSKHAKLKVQVVVTER